MRNACGKKPIDAIQFVSIVLPAYNEAGNIGALIREILRVVDRPMEIIVIDDDSPDETWKIVQKMELEDGRIRLIRRTAERGLASAIRRGIGEAKGDVVAWMDCDFSHPPALLPEMLRILDEGHDLVVPSRYVAGGADKRDEPLHRVLSRIITTLARVFLDRRFRDYTSGFIAARKSIFDRVRLEGVYGEYFISLVYQALRLGYKVREIPFVNYSRKIGRSKTGGSWLDFAVVGRRYLVKVFKLATGLSKA